MFSNKLDLFKVTRFIIVKICYLVTQGANVVTTFNFFNDSKFDNLILTTFGVQQSMVSKAPPFERKENLS